MPLISVVTVTWNAASTLEACIDSVAHLKGSDVEFIVVDGASTDGTREILERRAADIDLCISEPDRGIYDAMNKALDRATGEYVLFLGADDVLLHVPRRELSQDADLVLGDVDCGGWIFQHLRPETALRKLMRYRNAIHPQGACYRRTSLRYSLNYLRCADYLFNVEYLRQASQVVYCETAISRFCTEGASSGWAAKREIIRIASQYFGFSAMMHSAIYHFGSHCLNIWRKTNAN